MKKHLLLLAAAFATSNLAQAVVVIGVPATLAPSKDTTIYETVATHSNGAGEFIFAGNTNNNISNSPRRALLAFDLSSIPAGSTIDSAVLTLTVSLTISGDQSMSLHRLSADWGEAGSDAPGAEGQGILALAGDATWGSNVVGTSNWAAAGGDFVGGASATSLVGLAGTTPTWSGAGMTADVQDWLDNPSQNFGWILIGNEGVQGSAKRFHSREGAASPSLLVNFTPVPEPSSATLLLVGLAIAGRRRRC